MNVRDEIRKAIEYGIYLGELTKEEEGEFLKKLQIFLIRKGNFCVYHDPTHTIGVSDDFKNLASIFIHNNTLKATPLSPEGYFKVFMDVLEFIAKSHKESMKQIEQKDPPDCSEEDESTEDDDLWL